jgi:hypothetical protein
MLTVLALQQQHLLSSLQTWNGARTSDSPNLPAKYTPPALLSPYIQLVFVQAL